MSAPTLALQIAAVETAIRTFRKTLQLLQTIGVKPGADDLIAEYEARVANLEAAARTLRATRRPAPPERAAS